jgi:hypothetical protein
MLFILKIKAWVSAHRLEIGIFSFALFVRLVVIGFAFAHEGYGAYYNLGADGSDYINEATNLLNGHGFSRSFAPPYLPDALRTPLYPLFLATVKVFTGSFLAVFFVEAIISSFLPVLYMRMTAFFVRDRRVYIAGALFLAVEPHFVFNTIFFSSEGISVILITWALFELLKFGETGQARKAGFAGAALALATLARPITTYAPLFLLPLFSKHRKAFGIFCVAFVLVLSPWLVRNYVAFGSAGMGTVGWFNVYTRLAATVVAIDTGDDFYTSYHKLLDNLSVKGHIKHPPPVSELEIQDPRLGEVLRDESLRILGEHKKALAIYLITYPFSVLTQDNTLGYLGYLGFTDVARPPFSPTLYLAQHGPLPTLTAVAPYLASPYLIPYIMRVFFFGLFLASAVGAWLLWRKNKRYAALLLFGSIGYIVLFSLNAGGQIDGRYRSQFLIAETVLAAVALDRAVSKKKT